LKRVLDTNVWLDLLVFEDSRVARLAELDGPVLATEPMLQEFAIVLARPVFALDEAQRATLLARQRSLVTVCAPSPDCRLACTDRNDQMFIDLAVAHRADWLVTRDKALLRLARHANRRFGLRIGTPESLA
jgi:putative PIN family toxin of toxin-antitoxin system